MKTSWWFGVVGAMLLAVVPSVALAEEPAEKKEELLFQKGKEIETYNQARAQRSKLQTVIQKLEKDEIPKLQQKKEMFSRYKRDEEYYLKELKKDEAELGRLRKALETAPPAEKKNLQEKVQKLERELKYDQDRLEPIKEYLSRSAEERKQVEEDLKKRQDELAKRQQEAETLENLMSDMLDIIRPKQSFKYNMSLIFAILVGFVIVGFFWVAYLDETVRRGIFSGTAGIQFVTLFSLVIAIILFGIIDILEGKELAALLGGLSGYILGRATSEKGP